MKRQEVARLLFPPQCVLCDELTESEFSLCGSCWREAHFIDGVVCDGCGTPLPGQDDGHDLLCDDCMTLARPWAQARAALRYSGNGRRLVLALKHGDRLDLVRPAVTWMASAARPIWRKGMCVVPVPVHWTRLFRRRYNQAAELARGLSDDLGGVYVPEALKRIRATPPQDGRGRDARFANIDGSIVPNSGKSKALTGKEVLLIDDVMTSGATLAAATEACHAAGATRVSVLVLARVAKGP